MVIRPKDKEGKYVTHRTSVEKKCKNCGELFKLFHSRRFRLYCSSICMGKDPNFRLAISKRLKGKHNLKITGPLNYNWKGSPASENEKARKSLEYKLWREAVFSRDSYTCTWCGARNGNGKRVILNADHIKPFALFPELRFAIDNGRTLCKPCHITTDTYGNRIKYKKYD